ncbi:PucR family transcriptional regulator [Enterococcus mediterraneensis]|uniref:PucR family transcriptional regulator n=1 Tax=Enterococcus mediterraneensis TaxID=2364791 RepID=UPI000F05256C|nr:PucR family transcriptional regulator [Enterococcus mediterraneensis]
MKIKDLLELSIFRGSKILTGNIGMEYEVESVMVLEAIDIENWSKENQLILTSFYAFENLDQSALTEFFKKMKEMGISGLVVKVERLIKLIPHWFIKLAEDYEIPLIKVEKDLTYEKIMLAIYEPILDYQSHVLHTYYDVRQRFTKIERNLTSFEQIMHEFQSLIKKDCELQIPSKNLTIASGKQSIDSVVVKTENLKKRSFTKNNYELLTLYSYQTAKEFFALKVNIINRYADDCILYVYQDDSFPKETDLMIIENAVDVIQEKLQLEYLIQKDRFARLNNLAEAILQDPPRNVDELNGLLEEACLNDFPYYQGIAFSTQTLNSRLLKKEILYTLRSLQEKTIFFEHHNYLIVLYNLPDKKATLDTDRLKRTFQSVLSEYQPLTFAISTVKEKTELKEILLECLDIIRFNQEYYLDCIVEYSQLGLFRYFLREHDIKNLEKLIPDNLVELSEQNYDLFKTLVTFFQNNRNYKKTAEILFLHSKTVRYRMNKIEDILSLDLTNPIQVLNYETGTYLLDLKKRSATNEHRRKIN